MEWGKRGDMEERRERANGEDEERRRKRLFQRTLVELTGFFNGL